MVKAETSPHKSRQSEHRWLPRDWMAGIALFAGTVCVVLWQNAHVAVLWDLSYILDSAARIAAGQMPYRDFPFVYPPLTFLIQAAIIRFAGRVYFHHVLYAAFVGGLGTVITWRIALRSLRTRIASAWAVTLLIAAPLTFLGIYSIVPIPEYDGDCAFSILVALWLLQRADTEEDDVSTPGSDLARGCAAGIAICLPMFFKQNMGLPFFVAAIGGGVALRLVAKFGPQDRWVNLSEKNALPGITGGAALTLLASVLALHWTAGLGNYLYWTVRFAGQRRLPGLATMLGIYHEPSLLWSLPCVAIAVLLLNWPPRSRRASVLARGVGSQLSWLRIAAFALLAAPFVVTLASLLLYDDADSRGDSLLSLWPLLLVLAVGLAFANLLSLRRKPSIRPLFPFLILAAITGTFMSQQLWGSTYAIWPLLVLLVAELLVFLERLLSRRAPARWFVPALAALISVTLLVCGGFYTSSEEHLSYLQFPDGPVQHSAFPQLAGLATPGQYLPELDELLRYAQANIPQDDGLILVPGEEPFYFVTGRIPRFPVQLFDPTTDPYSPAQIADLVQSNNIRWLIVKRDLQINADPTPDRDATMQLLMEDFTLAAHLDGYDVYRRS
jgi:hypothetical protein